jgi:hypothetical protein
MRLLCMLGMAALLCACGQPARDDLADARQHLADADYAGAAEAAEAGLAKSPEARTAWGLELVRLEARARAGEAEAAKAQLQSLAERYPERLPPTQYTATADQLRAAGQGAAAIEVLDLGLKRHPGDTGIEKMIGAAASDSVDSGELEMLRTLGYIE